MKNMLIGAAGIYSGTYSEYIEFIGFYSFELCNFEQYCELTSIKLRSINLQNSLDPCGKKECLIRQVGNKHMKMSLNCEQIL